MKSGHQTNNWNNGPKQRWTFDLAGMISYTLYRKFQGNRVSIALNTTNLFNFQIQERCISKTGNF